MSPKTSLASNHEAVDALCEMFRESLGIAGSVRCIVAGDQQEVAYVQDVVDILKCLDIEHPVAAYVVKVCQGHKDVYGCGVKSMLFFIGQLCKHIRQLTEQGVPLFYIEELLDEAIEDCISGISELKPVTIPVIVRPTASSHPPDLILSATPQDTHRQHSPSAVTLPGLQPNHPLSWQSPSSFGSISENNNTAPMKLPPADTASRSYCEDGLRSDEKRNKNVSDDVGDSEFKVISSKSTPDVHDPVIAHNCTNVSEIVHRVSGSVVPEKTDFETLQQTNQNLSTQKPSSSKAGLGSLQHPSTNQLLNLIKNGQLSSGNFNSFLLNSKNVTTSTSLHKRVMLRSRHFKNSDKTAEVEVSDGIDSNSSSNQPVSKNTLSDDSQVMGRSDLPLLVGKEDCFSSADEKDEPARVLGQVQLGEGVEKRGISLPEDAQDLSHNCEEMMSWAQEVIQQQVLCGSLSKLDVNLIHTSCVSGPHGCHRLVNGLVVHADTDSMQAVSKMTGPVSVLLINGDLTTDYKHKGYKATLSATQVIEGQVFLNQKKHTWHAQVIALLQKLEVDVVLVRGLVDADVKAQSMAAGIVLVDRVPFPALTVLQAACQTDFVTYILEAHESNVCTGICFRPLLETWCDSLSSEHKHLIITASVFMQTLVISSPSMAGREILEEQFWHCTARLTQAAQDGKVLAGDGATERWCAHLLTTASKKDREIPSLKWPGETSLYRPVVRATLAEAFLAYSVTATRNRLRAGHSPSNHSVSTVCEDFLPTSSSPDLPRANHPICAFGETRTLEYSVHEDSSCLAPNHSVCGGGEEPRISNKRETMPEVSRDLSLLPPVCVCDCDDLRGMAEMSHMPNCNINVASACPNQSQTQSLPGVDTERECASNNLSRLHHTSRHFDQKHQSSRTKRGENLDLGKGMDLGKPQVPGAVPQVMNNSGCDVSAVCDNYNSKISGWRTAVKCVCTVMRMDAIITTGVDKQTQPKHTVLL
ncbi:uncharacterized protein [Littorina saxatilis]|uniref:Bardet-Biedl syndrome 12 n=1 Tax=Littorina saxatilis TaxID=31220 RepID=A0AAN9BS79_9CAEN